ncbi:MAG: alpha/beta fold hydrolase, partial [Solirubrobacteraceae bacterium]
MSFDLRYTTIHGHRVAYRLAGDGPPIILIHGITASSQVWEPVAERLAANHTVLAPDLLGHGQSAKPRGD